MREPPMLADREIKPFAAAAPYERLPVTRAEQGGYGSAPVLTMVPR